MVPVKVMSGTITADAVVVIAEDDVAASAAAALLDSAANDTVIPPRINNNTKHELKTFFIESQILSLLFNR